MLPPPPPTLDTFKFDDSFQVVHVSSLAAALVKLNIDVPIEDLLKAIHEVEDEARLKITNETTSQRLAALSKLALQPTETEKIPGLKFTTVSTFVPSGSDPAKPTNIDPLVKERRRRLIEMTNEAFPDGKIPDPFIITHDSFGS